jgi:uncharacterized repeat protein (TIGR01451 family)
MKKIIIALLTLTMLVTSVPSITNAQAVFNSPAAMPTLTVASSSVNPCNFGNIDGCWRTSTSARPGDIVGVHIFYHNTSNTPAEATTLYITPRNSGTSSSVTFRGGVASLSGPRSVGSATVNLSPSATLEYISGSARWHPNNSSTVAVNESALFGSSGFNIGTVQPGQQGVLVANFRVGNAVTVDECRIDSFTVEDSTIDAGESTVLRWRTTGMYDVDITPGYSNRSEDGSITISPSQTTTYTIYGRGTNCSDSDSVTVRVGERDTTRPQAITTAATVLSTTSARLNGIAIPNITSGSTSAWFEWGPSQSLGQRTVSQSVPPNRNSNYYSDVVNGLVPGTRYYYRAVVQNKNGIAYGEIVQFQTQAGVRTTTVTTPPVRVVTPQQPVVTTNTVIAQSAPSLLELQVQSAYDRMCVGGQMQYTVTYRNISPIVLENAVIQVTFPKEVTYVTSTRGTFEIVDQTLTLALGNIQPGEQGSVTIQTTINNTAIAGNLTVTTATVVYTNSVTRAQEDAIAYSFITITNDCPSVLVASAGGFWSFLPDTLLEWLLLILVILALVVLARQLYRRRDPVV